MLIGLGRSPAGVLSKNFGYTAAEGTRGEAAFLVW
jgi:hypothetical protein